jgi:hypothetical protein
MPEIKMPGKLFFKKNFYGGILAQVPGLGRVGIRR